MADARILIVEDEGITALDLQQRLTSMGYTARDAVSTGEEAVIKTEETRPDLVLMDIMLLGEMDGIAAAGQIHDRFDIPVIFLTAYATDETLQRAKATEPYGYLVKPLKDRDLHISIEMALYNHKMQKQLKELNEGLEQRVHDRTAQLEAANKELEGFSYSVSHDLRAPLRHITGFAELLIKKAPANLDEKSRHYLDVISDSAKQMGKLVDNLLSFSRMGSAEILQSRIDLDMIVSEAVEACKKETAGREIEWEIGSLPNVYGDKVMLKIVFENLLSNAIKFTRPRSRAMIEIGCIFDEPHEVIYYVKDNGVGFDMKYVDKLFGLFQRLHRPEEFEGTGLGLANVRRIIHRHGGRTWAEGAVNEGAKVYFSLPKIKEK